MTSTQNAPHKPHPADSAQRPQPVDPERDIDARSTAIWVSVSAVVLFISLYFMLPLFDTVLSTERNKKINELQPVEYQEVLEAERSFLRGEESRSGKSIEQVMREMAPK